MKGLQIPVPGVPFWDDHRLVYFVASGGKGDVAEPRAILVSAGYN